MNENDDKNEALGGRKRSASSGSHPDRIPSRNTAPAGTPAQKAPSVSPLSALSEPERVPSPAPSGGGSISDRPPGVDTISQSRTVGGQTARLKAKQRAAAVEEDLSPRPTDEKKPVAKPAEDARAKAQPANGRGGNATAAKASSRGAKDGAAWEADVKMSEPDLAPHSKAAVAAGPVGESRWPIAIAIGAVAFAIGSLLPLPFRRQLVGSTADAPAAAPPGAAAQGTAAPGHTPSAAPSPPPALTAATSPSLEQGDKPSATAATTSPPTAARPGAPSSSGKNPPKGSGKPGRVGDIF